MYTGAGRDVGQVIFGILVFLFFFIGFEVGFIFDISTYAPSSYVAPVSPYAALISLAFFLPFAFAYDGYCRAKQM